MTQPTPKSNLVRAFLRMKGWKHTATTEKYFVFTPPAELRFKRPFSYQIPVYETAPDYGRYIRNIVESIADIYELDYGRLLEELSKSKSDLKKDIEFKQQLLELAS